MAIHGFGPGKEFCEAIGVETNEVYDIQLNIPVDGAVTVTIKKYVHTDEFEKIKSIIERWELQEKDDINRIARELYKLQSRRSMLR